MSSCGTFFFMPFSSAFEGFILICNLISSSWRKGQPGSGGPSSASDDSCRYLSSNRSRSKAGARAGGGIKLHHAQPLQQKSLYTSKEIKLEWNLIQGEPFKWGLCAAFTWQQWWAWSPPARRLLHNEFILFLAYCADSTMGCHDSLNKQPHSVNRF